MKKRQIALTVVVMLTILQIATVAFAYNVFGKILIGGVGKQGKYTRGYWTDSSASTYSTLISNAMYNWCNTQNRHPYVRTSIWFVPSAKSSSVMDIYAQQTPTPGLLGETIFYRYAYDETIASPSIHNWTWCKIILYTNNLNQLTSFHREGTISHEMGHVFGLAHNNSMPSSVMCQYGFGRTVNRPSADDCNGINYLYPLSSN